MFVNLVHKRLGIVKMVLDDEDYDKIKHLKLLVNTTSNRFTYYVVANIKKKNEHGKWMFDRNIHVHREIMGLGDYRTDKRIVNHINGNGLDNRKCNLEICDILFNSQSFRCPNKNIGYYSMDKDGRHKKHRISFRVNKKRNCIRFYTKDEATNYLNNLRVNIKRLFY